MDEWLASFDFNQAPLDAFDSIMNEMPIGSNV